MKKHLVAILFVAAIGLCSVTVLGQTAGENQCQSCHLQIESDNGPAHQFARDVHAQHNLNCNDCHGGDPTLDDMDKVRAAGGFRGVPDRLEIPNFCARCHSDPVYMHQHNPGLPVDQLEKYKTSVHGIRLFKDKDRNVATCVSCHTAHSIGDAKTPFSSTYPMNVPKTCGTCHSDKDYMKEYGIPTDQEELYAKSVHGVALLQHQDLSAPACNNCHGNHGATPPEASSLAAVCGICHAIEATLYDASPHQPAFAELGLPMCETCHSNHWIKKPSDSFIGFGPNTVCGQCHNQDDNDAASHEIDSLKMLLTDLTASSDTAQQALQRARNREMMTTDVGFSMDEVHQIGIKSRSLIHAFTLDSVRTLFADGITKADAVTQKSQALVGEYYFRREGLGISLIIITFLAFLLYLKIRAIERKKS